MKIFIASSSESFAYAEAMQYLLCEKGHKAVTWKDYPFYLGNTVLESLSKVDKTYDYAIFIFYPDDELNFRGKTTNSVRDNVIFEMGMFIGFLGSKRCFAVMPDNINIKNPSDLYGIIHTKYNYENNDTDLKSTLRNASNEIIRSIKNNSESNISSHTLVRGNYRDNIVDASIDTGILDFELYQQWVENIKIGKRVKEELLYWERRTANKWLDYEKFIRSDLSHLDKLFSELKGLINQPIDIVSLGPGSGEKDSKLISTIIDDSLSNWYYPIDINSHLLFHTMKKITKNFEENYLKVKGIKANFNSLEKLRYIYQYTNQLNVFLLDTVLKSV